MFELTIDTQQLIARRKLLEQGKSDFPANLEIFSQQAGKVFRRNLVHEAPVSKSNRPDPDKRKSLGHAAAGIQTEVTGGGMKFTIRGTSQEKYLVYQAHGEGPHAIIAHSDSGLSFFWEKQGFWFKGMAVRHPGFAANPFPKRAFEKSLPEFEAGLRELAGKLGTR